MEPTGSSRCTLGILAADSILAEFTGWDIAYAKI
jgi:hypothetical protein